MRESTAVAGAFAMLILAGCGAEQLPKVASTPDFSAVSRVDSAAAISVMLTAYSTTLVADGEDWTKLRIAVTDSAGREITSAEDSVRIYVTGAGSVTALDGSSLPELTDSAGARYTPVRLAGGVATLAFRAGTTPDRVDVEARVDTLWPGGHQIHTIPAEVELLEPTPDQLPPTTKPIDRMIGADISFLPQIESGSSRFFEGRGRFYDDGRETDAIELLRNHGFNAIRLRIFVNPENEGGYSPETGFCGLDHTLAMARRIKEAGMGFLLDFHYSDYWADPQQQNKPLAWADLDYESLRDAVRDYTTRVLTEMEA